MSDRAVFPNRSHPGLRAARMRHEMSQDELAFISGVPQPRLSRAERGYLWLRSDERERIAGALGVTVDDLERAPRDGTRASEAS
jgi:transcriptional regulator with XRE-family HTH domain